VPDDPHQPFVISYNVFHNESTPHFRFVLSTKYFLELACGIEILHADATCKLIWQGFPVFILGTTDKNRKFHPLCLAVATSEQKDDFKMLFDALKNNVYSLFSSILQPTVLVCDAAKSIQNAFTEVFGNSATVRMCWAHAKMKIQTQVENIKNKQIQKSLLLDIDDLHSITCRETFVAASEAFLHKHQEQKEFIEYFREQWLVQNPNWYLGAGSISPSTNNALESYNKVIKDSNTLRERFPLSRFLVVAVEMVNEWSKKYTNTDNVFSKSPTTALKRMDRVISVGQNVQEDCCFTK
jgi:hypothetical protein